MNKIAQWIVGLIALAAMPNITATTLDDNCVINILNRTVQVDAQGGWFLTNVPSNMGQVRARATCQTDDGRTVSGQSDYFSITSNQKNQIGKIKFEQLDPIPVALSFSSALPVKLTSVGQSQSLSVEATYTDGSKKDISHSDSGINYSSTNNAVVTVSQDGLIVATGNGLALVSARKDGVLVSRRVQVESSGDLDGDGLPDSYETANGLNPADAVDALEDRDGDGLTALEEYNAGTDINNSDTDGDGISDSEELQEGEDGFITNALLADSDNDGIDDALEILTGTDPGDPKSGDFSNALNSISVSPQNLALTYNTIDTESTAQLRVTGHMLDGSEIDLTNASATNYQSADLSIASFSSNPGQVFAGAGGKTQITITNGDQSQVVDIEVNTFDPVAVAAIVIPGYANNVDVQGDYAYIAAGASGVQVVDVADPTKPKIIAALDTAGTAIDIKARGDHLYIADGSNGLVVMDISTPSAPQKLSVIDTAGIAQDLALQGDFAYLADGTSGITIINIANPDNLFTMGSITGLRDVKGIAVENNHLVAVSGYALMLFDISDPQQLPQRIDSANLSSLKDVAIDGGYIHIAAYNSGRLTYRIDSLNQLQLVASATDIVPRDVAIADGFVFYAEQLFPNVVALVNNKNKDNPFFQSTIDLSRFGDYAGTGIALNNTHAFITEEYYVARSDFKATGNTKLFIA